MMVPRKVAGKGRTGAKDNITVAHHPPYNGKGRDDMVKRSKGLRSQTRLKFRVRPRERGKSRITKALQSFKEGDKAALVVDPRIHKGFPHQKYQGQTGTVIGHQGRSYVLTISDKGKKKTLIVSPEHLKRC